MLLNMGKKILVLGSVNMDLVLQLDKMPMAGETIFGRNLENIPGGKGANQAVAAARLGADVFFAGRVGTDEYGVVLREKLEQNSIDTTFLATDEKEKTGVAIISVDSAGQNTIIVLPGANMAMETSDAEQFFANDSYDAVMMGLEVPVPVVYAVYKEAAKHNIPAVLDAGPAQEISLSELNGIEIISPNESETKAMTGIDPTDDESAFKAAELLYKGAQAKHVVLKLGKRGALIYSSEIKEIVPTYSNIKPVDTTAAGDSFTAAMTVHYLNGGDIKEAVQYANAVGSICVSRKGAQPSLPYKDEVERFIDENK